MTPVPGTHTPGPTSSEFPARCRWERVAGAAPEAECTAARMRAAARREELGGVEGGRQERVQGLVRPGRGDGTPASVRAASRRERSPHLSIRVHAPLLSALVPRSFTRSYRVFDSLCLRREEARRREREREREGSCSRRRKEGRGGKLGDSL